jgi:hypothetical protein
MAVREHKEAGYLHKVALSIIDLISLMMPLLIAFGVGLFAIVKAKTSRRRAVAVAYFGFSTVSACMAECYARYYHHAMTTVCAWLLWLWKEVIKRLPKTRAYTLSALGLFILIGPLWMLLLPAIDSNAPFLSQVLLYPAKLQTVSDACNIVGFGDYLNTHYGKDTLLMAPGADSSRLLYHTDLKIDFLNNYPSQDRFIDNEVFFGTQDLATAKDIALRHHIDLVAVCHLASNLPPLKPGEEPMLYERLESGHSPDWLKPVNTGVPGMYRLYQVDIEK